ncbi:MAG: hypothetical protein N4A74_17630 [Carboxylicivirga sp.]|jgi:hypothetical protein|nr:hypothetical protein [Carboxylicivirga sp.]
MNAIVKKIESKYGKLPLLYKEWIVNNVPFEEAYNQSDYLQWCDPKEIFNKLYNVSENDLRDGLLLIGVCGQEAFWYLDMRFDNRVLI